ncbi:MAG: DUF86 domain-containing protein [Actinobacteria bacterium]|nr:DUF86 domain-containing protein [Actinomycetota bacterium]
MTPRQLDRGTVQRKLELLSDLLTDLDHLGDVSAERLERERGTRHIVERVLTQLVDIAAGVNAHVVSARGPRAPSDYRGSFELLARLGAIEPELASALRSSVGLRNILTHEYGRIDLTKVAAAVPAAREQYGSYVEQVAAFLAEDASR